MESHYNTIVLTEEEFNNDLYTEVGKLLGILFRAGYVCVVREEEIGIVRIDYNYDVYKNFGNPIPIWLDEDEMESLFIKEVYDD